MFGCNDNPSARQFESAWRKLLGQHQISASESANCINNDIPFLNVLNVSSRKEKPNINHSDEENGNENNNIDYEDEFNQLDMIEDSYVFSLIDDTLPDSLEDHIASYFAAVLEKCIIERRWYSPINCKKCLLVFAEDETVNDEFVTLKMKSSKLLPPARSTVNICKATERAMKKFNYEPGKYKDMLNDVLAHINLNDVYWISNFETHKEPDHKIRLVKLIIEMYTKKKHDYISKSNTIAKHDFQLRSQLKKLIHFKGQ